MDESFRDYFRWRTQIFEGSLAEQRATLAAEEVPQWAIPGIAVQVGLETARREAQERGLDLREDAQLLIAILAQELVAQPVAAVTPEDAEHLPAILAEDIGTIVERAGETANDGQVSAHSVIDGLSASWDRLRSSNLRVWDRAGRAKDPGPESDPGDLESGADT